MDSLAVILRALIASKLLQPTYRSGQRRRLASLQLCVATFSKLREM
jgi:hypothetical protein